MEITLTIPPEKEAQVMTWFLSVHPNDRHVTVQQPNPEYVSPEETPDVPETLWVLQPAFTDQEWLEYVVEDMLWQRILQGADRQLEAEAKAKRPKRAEHIRRGRTVQR